MKIPNLSFMEITFFVFSVEIFQISRFHENETTRGQKLVKLLEKLAQNFAS